MTKEISTRFPELHAEPLKVTALVARTGKNLLRIFEGNQGNTLSVLVKPPCSRPHALDVFLQPQALATHWVLCYKMH